MNAYAKPATFARSATELARGFSFLFTTLTLPLLLGFAVGCGLAFLLWHLR